MKFRSSLRIMLIVVAIAAGFAVAQILPPAKQDPAQFFPQGAVVYWESDDLKGFLQWWKTSEFKKEWQKTNNYRAFENSRLYLRLQDRINNVGKDKYKFSLENLIQVAGRRSALAIYDIGNLKALAVTEISQADAALTELWIARTKFQEKLFNNHTYYLEPQEGKLAFTYAKPFLVISTEPGLLEEFLDNSNNTEQGQTIAKSEKWIACRPSNETPALFSIFLDQESLNQNRYFRRYWIHGNAKELTPIRSIWIDFAAEPKGLIEHRYFAPTNDASNSDTQPSTASQVWIDAFEDLNADFLAIEPLPDPTIAAESILKLINKFPEPQQKTSYPPAYAASFERASQAESKNPYLVRIDDPVLKPAEVQILENKQPAALASLLSAGKPALTIRLATPIWDNDGLFVNFQETQIYQLQNFEAISEQEFLNQMQDYFLLLASAGKNGAAWIHRNDGSYELQSLVRIFVRFKKPWLVISNSEKDFHRTVAALPSQPITAESMFVSINWQNSRWKYSRLMRRLDYGGYSGDVPLFFSQNLDSLFQALYSVKRSTITKTPNKEVIHYEIQ